MMDKNQHQLSTRLCAVLDIIGASEDVRKLFWENSMAIEILQTFSTLSAGYARTSCYNFGSTCEGTTTAGLESDRDVLICYEDMPVIDRITDVTARLCYLVVNDCNTKPGYVHLQKIIYGIPQCRSHRPLIQGKEEFDEYGRTCLIQLKEASEKKLRGGALKTKITGPAVTVFGGKFSSDHVDALRCRRVPHFANSWIHRTRKYDWPSHKQIQKMTSFGCFLVGVAHPNSYNKSLKWRISFSLQERELMSSLNPTQHKCYILLKIIKHDFIESGTISSYHFKTCLFYTIEASESSLWNPGNLILCTRMCLVRLLNWSKNKNCPNYFIPEENMFDKLDKDRLKTVTAALTFILSSGIEFLFQLRSDNIGALFRRNPSGLTHNETDKHTKRRLPRHSVAGTDYFSQEESDIIEERVRDESQNTIGFMLDLGVVFHSLRLRNMMLLDIHTESNDEILFILQSLLRKMQETNQVTEHSTRDVRMALSYIIPHIRLQITQSMAAVVTRRKGTNTNDQLQLAILLNMIESCPPKLSSARVSLAAFYLKFGMLEACEQLLLTVETDFKPFVRTICSCYRSHNYWDFSHQIKLVSDCYETNTETFIDTYTPGCVVFLQSQAHIVHPALQYEMYRSVYTNAHSRDEIMDVWFDWVVVDPKIYLYFLQYIFCTETNKPGHRRRIVETCRKAVHKKEQYIVHWETAYNVLGWMLIQENRKLEACQYFCQSWRIKPFHNAAKWHIVLLLNDLLR